MQKRIKYFYPAVRRCCSDSIVVNIPNSFNVVDVNVRRYRNIRGILTLCLNYLTFQSKILHSYLMWAEPAITLFSVNWTIRQLLNYFGTPPFTGTWRPTGALNIFNNIPVNGSWRLNITDQVGGDSGYLRAWCIRSHTRHCLAEYKQSKKFLTIIRLTKLRIHSTRQLP
jgi:hypothetical protein